MIHEVQLAAPLLNPKISNTLTMSEKEEKNTKTFIIDYAQPIGFYKNKILHNILANSLYRMIRNWSNYSNIKTKKRNRTTIDRTKKLVSIQFKVI
jgi:hypothetical protein